MIQRIQTAYLFLAVLINAVFFLVPMAKSEPTQAILVLNDGEFELSENLILTILHIVATLLIFVAIFLFRFRKMQAKFTLATAFLNALTATLAAYQTYELIITAATKNIIASWWGGTGIPVVSILLLLLAVRGIWKDDKLVKSADRLR